MISSATLASLQSVPNKITDANSNSNSYYDLLAQLGKNRFNFNPPPKQVKLREDYIHHVPSDAAQSNSSPNDESLEELGKNSFNFNPTANRVNVQNNYNRHVASGDSASNSISYYEMLAKIGKNRFNFNPPPRRAKGGKNYNQQSPFEAPKIIGRMDAIGNTGSIT